MDRKQQNHYDMYVATHRFLLEHQSAWSGNAMIPAAAGKLKTLIDMMAATNSIIVNAEGPGLRKQRDDALTAAINGLTEITAMTSNWAADIPEEKVLYRLVSTMGYQLRGMSLANRLERMKAMLDASEAAAPRIPDNPLRAEVYHNARACLNTYIELDGAARNSDAQRIAAAKRLQALITECTELLKRIDRMLETFQRTQPELHARYKAVRNILDLGGSAKRAANKAVRKAQKAAQKAREAAILAAETARIADEEAKNRLRLAELKKSLGKGADTGTAAQEEKGAADGAQPENPLPPAESGQVG